MKKVLFVLFIALFTHSLVQAQIEKTEPPFWWTNMPVEELQLQLYGENLGHYRATIDYPGVKLTSQIAVDSPNYLFLYLEVSPEAKAGEMKIVLKNGKKKINLDYELKSREPQEGRNAGFDSSDLIYLMMPDRFANGDPDNDTIEGMLEAADTSDPCLLYTSPK